MFAQRQDAELLVKRQISGQVWGSDGGQRETSQGQLLFSFPPEET